MFQNLPTHYKIKRLASEIGLSRVVLRERNAIANSDWGTQANLLSDLAQKLSRASKGILRECCPIELVT